jgi:hypothetical protein
LINAVANEIHRRLYNEYIVNRGRSPVDSRNHPRQTIEYMDLIHPVSYGW